MAKKSLRNTIGGLLMWTGIFLMVIAASNILQLYMFDKALEKWEIENARNTNLQAGLNEGVEWIPLYYNLTDDENESNKTYTYIDGEFVEVKIGVKNG